MLTAKDFRIGNTIQLANVVEIRQDGLVIEETIEGHQLFLKYSEVDPVFLAEALLVERYQFTRNPAADNALLYREGLPIQRQGSGFTIISPKHPTVRIFRYLHELENLYFALYRKELTDEGEGHAQTVHPRTTDLTALRVGNRFMGDWVYNQRDVIVTVLELRQTGVIHSPFTATSTERGIEIGPGIDGSDPILPAWIKPIPLTADWLTECGFEPSTRNPEVFHLGRINLLFKPPFAILTENNHQFGRPVQSVHELQNLIYSITGKELIPYNVHDAPIT